MHLWNVILHHFTDDGWKENFRSTQQSFIITKITSARYVRYAALSYFFIIAHAQNFPVLFFSAFFTCPIERIRKGFSHPSQPD